MIRHVLKATDRQDLFDSLRLRAFLCRMSGKSSVYLQDLPGLIYQLVSDQRTQSQANILTHMGMRYEYNWRQELKSHCNRWTDKKLKDRDLRTHI